MVRHNPPLGPPEHLLPDVCGIVLLYIAQPQFCHDVLSWLTALVIPFGVHAFAKSGRLMFGNTVHSILLEFALFHELVLADLAQQYLDPFPQLLRPSKVTLVP